MSAEFLNITPEKLQGIETRLGRAGAGAFHIPDAITPQAQELLLTEMGDKTAVQWWDVHDEYFNERDKLIIQNHDVFALKLSRGNMEQVEKAPYMHQLAREQQVFIQSLHKFFPSLLGWEADEMSYHDYDDIDIGLSYHKDNLRFPGVVAVTTIEGASDFNVLSETEIREYNPDTDKNEVVDRIWHSTYTIPVRPRSLVLMRAVGLVGEDIAEDLRPEHAVLNVQEDGRIAFMLRDNTKPDDTSYGFSYANWGKAPTTFR